MTSHTVETTATKTTTTIITCPHSEGKNAPVCWDCAEQGHPRGGGISPTRETFEKIKRSFKFRDRNKPNMDKKSAAAGMQSSAPEVHPPAEGIEVGAPDLRKSQPGLEVLSGPKIVSPDDKYRKPGEHKSWDTELDQKVVVVPGARTICGLPRRTFVVLIACLLLVLVGTAVGVAVGLTQRDRALSTAKSGNAGGDSPTADPTSGAGNCLGVNGTMYKDHGTGVEFRIECAEAHQGKDIDNVKSDTMEDCVSLCAKNSACKGAIYYNVGPQGTDYNYCWLKSAMQDQYIYTTDAQSVVRI
ncbi:hypothetical protein F4779DRAFT_594514 [Xylariaceae sp. FL0662B]|nr:hypothetical protein F4779DRAFT_594514 [Xylariaceae sp. FL0662B]